MYALIEAERLNVASSSESNVPISRVKVPMLFAIAWP
jgi:hypothetical protein